MQDIDSDHKDQEETVAPAPDLALRAQRRLLRAAAAAEASYLMSVSPR
jgi:hypothetical protein